MVKYQSYSNYASIMASQGIQPDSYEKWSKGAEDSTPINTNSNSAEAIAEFEAMMNEQERASRKSK